GPGSGTGPQRRNSGRGGASGGGPGSPRTVDTGGAPAVAAERQRFFPAAVQPGAVHTAGCGTGPDRRAGKPDGEGVNRRRRPTARPAGAPALRGQVLLPGPGRLSRRITAGVCGAGSVQRGNRL